MNNFKPGDRVFARNEDESGLVLAVHAPWAWVDVPIGPLTFHFDSLTLAPPTVREAAEALADNVATDPGGVTDTQARLLDDLRAALAAEDVYLGDTPDPCPECDAEDGAT